MPPIPPGVVGLCCWSFIVLKAVFLAALFVTLVLLPDPDSTFPGRGASPLRVLVVRVTVDASDSEQM